MSLPKTAMSDQALQDYDLLRDHCGYVPLPDLSLIELTGEDRKGWLQGQVTNNVRRLESGNSSSFCFTAPTGHLLSVVDSWALDDRILLTCHRDTEEAVLHRIEQMVVMEDVMGSNAATSYQIFSIQGPNASQELSQHIQLPNLDAAITSWGETTIFCLRSDRTGLGGWDIWVPLAATETHQQILSLFSPIGDEAHDVARIEAGIPRYGQDMTSKTLPPEMGPAFIAKHISYNKGCYVGQEVLMRMHSRGHANRCWVGLISDRPLEIGSPISHPSRNDAGVITSAAYSPDFGFIGAAMIRREVANPGEEVKVQTSSGISEAEVRLMPLLRFD